MSKHDELAADLAQHLLNHDRHVWCDMQMGPAGSPRPDVWTMDKSFAHTRAIAYECKVSVADFRADVTAGKWQSYLGFSSGVYFACPAGLLSKSDVPKGCGLIVRGDVGWRTLRAPTLQPCDIDWVVCRKLLIDGMEKLVRPAPRRERTHWGANERIAKRWGQDAARAIADLDRAREDAREAKQAADLLRADMAETVKRMESKAEEKLRSFARDAATTLGLPHDSPTWRIVNGIRELRLATSGELTEQWARQLRRKVSELAEIASRIEAVAQSIDPAVAVQAVGGVS